MDHPFPAEPGVIADEPLPITGERGDTVGVKGCMIGQHDHVRVQRQRFFHGQQFGKIVRQYDVVGIQPQTVVHGGGLKGNIPCGGEIVPPGKGKHLCPKPPGNLHSAVGTAGVHHNEFVCQGRGRLETAFQNRFLIFYNHTKTDGDQTPSLHPESIVQSMLLLYKGCRNCI